MQKQLDERYNLSEFPIDHFKKSSNGECMEGTAGPYRFSISQSGNVLVDAKKWVARYFDTNFIFLSREKKSKLIDVQFDEKGVYFKVLSEKERLSSKKAEECLTLDEVKALNSHKDGKIKLSAKTLAQLSMIVDHESQIREAYSLSIGIQNLRMHPDFVRFVVEKNLALEKPLLTENEKLVLSAIDAVSRRGEVTPYAVWQHISKAEGLGDSRFYHERLASVIAELIGDGCIERTDKGLVLTAFGRSELEKHSGKAKTSEYIV